MKRVGAEANANFTCLISFVFISIKDNGKILPASIPFRERERERERERDSKGKPRQKKTKETGCSLFFGEQ